MKPRGFGIKLSLCNPREEAIGLQIYWNFFFIVNCMHFQKTDGTGTLG